MIYVSLVEMRNHENHFFFFISIVKFILAAVESVEEVLNSKLASLFNNVLKYLSTNIGLFITIFFKAKTTSRKKQLIRTTVYHNKACCYRKMNTL